MIGERPAIYQERRLHPVHAFRLLIPEAATLGKIGRGDSHPSAYLFLAEVAIGSSSGFAWYGDHLLEDAVDYLQAWSSQSEIVATHAIVYSKQKIYKHTWVTSLLHMQGILLQPGIYKPFNGQNSI